MAHHPRGHEQRKEFICLSRKEARNTGKTEYEFLSVPVSGARPRGHHERVRVECVPDLGNLHDLMEVQYRKQMETDELPEERGDSKRTFVFISPHRTS